MSRFTRRLTQVRFQDANGLGMDVTPTEGNISMGSVNAEFAEHQAVYDRDVHDGFTLGQDQVQECSITVQMQNESLTHATLARILDFIHKRGSFAGAQSVDATIWCWETVVTYDDGTTSTTRTLPKCEGGAALSEGQPTNTIEIAFNNHQQPVDA